MADLATVRIHRPELWWTAGPAVVVEVDGREVGRLRNGKNLMTHLETGQHHLRARQWGVESESLELELVPGEDVRLETRYDVANSGLTYKLSLVRTENPGKPPVRVLGATETHMSEDPIGTEQVRIENTSSAARLTRTMRVTREWSRTVSLDHNVTNNSSNGGGVDWLLSWWTNVEQSLSCTYLVSKSRREEFAEEFSVEVEPGAAVTVVLAWKRLWQHGVVHVLFQGHQVEVPFRVAVGITFDQSLV